MQRRLLLLLAASAAFLVGQDEDPPSRVARLNYTSGSVSLQPAGLDEWGPASLNRPLTIGDQLWVDDNSQAEMHIGSAGLRLGPATAFQILNLNDQTAQFQITSGSLNIHLRFLDPEQSVEVDTPSFAFTLLRPGDYRIDAGREMGKAWVRSGQGEITGGGQNFPLNSGQMLLAQGTDQVSFDLEPVGDQDAFDIWCAQRINYENRSVSLRYVNPEMIGYQDLDNHGSWTQSEYGPTWYPRDVPADWAPYHDGHWAWVDPWGWTWVDDASWGFAPFHYGRWAYVGNRWGWVPGPIHERPVYAPALVAWVGGSNWSVSASFGGGGAVAWVPLGPREVYVPSYHVSERYFTRVNTSSTVVERVNITNVYQTTVINRSVVNVNYVNARAPHAIVAAPVNALASARPIREVARPVTAQQFSQARVVVAAPVVPLREAVLGHPTIPAGVRQPPPAALRVNVVAKTAPPPPPVSFRARETVLQQHPGQPVDPRAMQQLRSSAPAPAVQRPVVRVAQPVQQTAAPQQGHHTAPMPQNVRGGQPMPGQRPANEPNQPPAARPAYTPPPQPNRPGPTPQNVTPQQQQQQARPANVPQQPPANERRQEFGQQPQERRPENVTPQARPANAPQQPPANERRQEFGQQPQERRPENVTPNRPTPTPQNVTPQQQPARPAYTPPNRPPVNEAPRTQEQRQVEPARRNEPQRAPEPAARPAEPPRNEERQAAPREERPAGQPGRPAPRQQQERENKEGKETSK